jgi:hypothetical protein
MSILDEAEIFDLDTDHYLGIRQAYHCLWGFFNNITGLDVNGTNENLDISHENGEVVTVKSTGLFKIKGVGFEVGSSGGPIDIYFRPDLTIIGAEYDGRRNPIIKSSETAVSYVKVDGTDGNSSDGSLSSEDPPATVLNAFHYDFDIDVQDRHPLFHAQYEPSSIQIGALEADYDIQNESHVTASFPNHPRVPTAPLDFAGVLCTLIQEHMTNFDIPWPNGTLEAVADLPKIPAWCFKPTPLCGDALLPEWWYLRSRGETRVPDGIVESRGVR